MRTKISTLKRAKFLLVALALVLTSAPFTPLWSAGEASAAGTCAETRQELETLVGDTSTAETITLCPTGDSITLSGRNGLRITRSLTLDLSGKTLMGDVTVRDGATVTIKNGAISGNITAGSNSTSGTINIESGTYSGSLRARRSGSSINVAGGTFTATGNNAISASNGATITITGGSFKSNPTNYVPEGYSVTSTGSFNNRTYTVTKDAVTTASDIVVPVNGAAALFTVSPATANYTTTITKAGVPVTDAISVATATVDDVLTGTATGLAVGEYTFSVTAGDKTETSTVTVYEAEELDDDIVLFVNDTYDVDVDFADDVEVDYTVSLADRGAVVSIDGKTITALESGEAEVTVSFGDTLQTTKNFTVHVYDFNEEPESLIINAGDTATIRPESTRTATLGDEYDNEIVSVTGNEGEYTIEGLSAGKTELEFSIETEAQETLTKIVAVYVFKAPAEAWVEISENEDVEIEKPEGVTIVGAASSDARLVGFEGDDYTLIGYRAGDATVTYTLGVDGKTATADVTVHVYRADIPDGNEIVLMEGTTININDAEVGTFENGEAIRIELFRNTEDEEPTTLTGTTVEDGVLTANDIAGLDTVIFYAGDKEIATVDFRVFTEQIIEDVLLSVSGRGAGTSKEVVIDDYNIPAFTLSSDSENVSIDGTTISAVSAGDATITVTFEAYNNPTTTFNVKVSDFTTSRISNQYNMAEGGEAVTVTVSEAYDQDFIECKISGADCASSDVFTVTPGENGEWTIALKEGANAGRYTLTFTDTMIDRNNTATVNIVVRKIEISETEYFAEVGENVRFTARIRGGNNTERLSATVISADGGQTNNATVFCINGSCRMSATKAGQYTIRLSDTALFGGTVYATKDITLYVIDFNVEDTEYHIVKGDTAPKLVKTLNEYWNKTGKGASSNFMVTANSDTEYYFWPTNAEAGDYEIEFYAYAGPDMTVVRDTKTVAIHVYEMVAPEETTYYVYTGDQVNIPVTDKNSHAYTRAVVEEGDADVLRFNRRTNGNLRNFNVTARRAGVYKVRYTDYMGNGEVVDEFVATIIVVEAEELNNVIVRKGNTLEFTGNNAWDASTAYNTTTGDELTVSENDEGEMVAVFNSAELEPGKYTVEVSHEFEDGVSMVVKRANIIVYEILTDSENDPEGVIADTIEQYLNSLVESGKIDELLETSDIPFVGPIIDLARIATLLTDDTTTSTLGSGFEGLSGLLGLHETLNDGISISTRVNVRPFDEEDEVDEELSEFIATLGYNAKDLMFFDVTVVMSDGTDDFGVLHELTEEITFVLCEVSEPQDGYTREWVVIRQHNGVSEVLPATKFFIKDGKLYVSSSEFSTYAVTFEDTKIPDAPDTGNYTAESRSRVDVAGILATSMMVMLVAVALKDVFSKKQANKD